MLLGWMFLIPFFLFTCLKTELWVYSFNWSGTVVPVCTRDRLLLSYSLGRNANKFNFHVCCALISLQVQQSFLLHSGCVLTRQPRASFNWKTLLRLSSLVNKTGYPHFRFVLVFSIKRHNTSLVSGFCSPPIPHFRPVGSHGNGSHPVIWMRSCDERRGNTTKWHCFFIYSTVGLYSIRC